MADKLKLLEKKIEKLQPQLKHGAIDFHRAFLYAQSDPGSSLNKTRIVMERILLDTYRREMEKDPKKSLIGEILKDNQFTRRIQRRMLSRMHAIRDMANLGTHGELVEEEDAIDILENLCKVVEWYLDRFELWVEVEVEVKKEAPVKKEVVSKSEKKENKKSKENIEEAFAKGKSFFNDANHDQAHKVWDEILKKDPHNTEILCWKAHTFVQEDQLKESEAIIENILKDEPENAHALIGKAIILTRKKDFKQSNTLLDKVIADNPSLFKAYSFKAFNLRYLNREKEAIDYNSKSISIEPGYIYNYTNRAWCYLLLNMKEDAWNDIETARKISDLNYYVFYLIGYFYSEDEKYEKSIDNYSRAIELNPKDTNSYINRAINYSKLNKKELQIQDYNKAIEINPSISIAYLNRGIVSYNEKRYEKAIDDLNKAIEFKTDEADGYFLRGLCYYELKFYEKAIGDFNKALTFKTKEVEGHFMRGLCFHAQNEYEKAINDFSKVLKLDPAYKLAHYNRGLAKFQSNDPVSALKDFQKEAELFPSYYLAHFYCGRTSYTLKNYEEAVKYFSKAIELDPKDPDAFNNRGLAHEKLKNYSKAFYNFSETIRINDNYDSGYKNRAKIQIELGLYQAAIRDLNKSIELTDGKRTDDFYLRAKARFLAHSKFELSTSSTEFFQSLKLVLSSSREEAVLQGHQSIDISHLILGIISIKAGYFNDILLDLNVKIEDLEQALKRIVKSIESKTSELIGPKVQLKLSPKAEKALKLSFMEARLQDLTGIGPDELVLSILKDDEEEITKLFAQFGIDYQSYRKILREYYQDTSVDAIRNRLENIKDLKGEAVKNQQYEKAAKLRDEERKLVKKLDLTEEGLKKTWKAMALADLHKVISQDSKNGHALSLRGRIYFLQGYYSDAITDLSQAVLKKSSDLTDDYYFRAQAYEKKGEIRKAMDDISKARELDKSREDINEYHKKLLDILSNEK